MCPQQLSRVVIESWGDEVIEDFNQLVSPSHTILHIQLLLNRHKLLLEVEI